MSEDRDDLLSRLRARVGVQEAAGGYAEPWLADEVVPENPPTPADAFLRTGRPLRDRAAAAGTPGRAGQARKAVARALSPARPGWHEEQLAFEERLREAVAWLTVERNAAVAARERADRELAELRARVERLEVEAEAAGEAVRAAATLGERVAGLENAQRAAAIERARATPAGAGGGGETATGGGIPPLTDFDYLGFENRFRGSEELVRSRQRHHADRFAGVPGPVADLGCGRGEFLELLAERGIPALGVDLSAQMVALARERGLAAEHGDVFAWLAAREPGSLGGVICSHVVEHLWPADHMRLARLCAAAVAPGGVVVVETPNPKSLIAGAVNFPCDPTHLRPVFPETLAFMLEQAGFADVEIEYLSPVPAERRAEPVTGEPRALEDVVRQINRSIARLDDLVFGDMDYAVVARRAPA
jgi:O-antigen chain-terminating methyltransferase